MFFWLHWQILVIVLGIKSLHFDEFLRKQVLSCLDLRLFRYFTEKQSKTTWFCTEILRDIVLAAGSCYGRFVWVWARGRAHVSLGFLLGSITLIWDTRHVLISIMNVISSVAVCEVNAVPLQTRPLEWTNPITGRPEPLAGPRWCHPC